MEKELLTSGKTLYTGTIFDFNYMKELNTDEEFETWIKAKLIKYKMNPLKKRIYQYILGMDKLLDRIVVLEEKIK